MLEIKTITKTTARRFDEAVNEALAEGWELVRRECFITGSDLATTFYAELERMTEEPEVAYTIDSARWVLTRNIHNPYRCNACGYTAKETWAVCPGCERVMVRDEE